MNQLLPVEQTLTHSIEAEQQVLGALLLNADLIEKMGVLATPDIFFDPVHTDLFSAIQKRYKVGDLVSPVALKPWADSHEGMKPLGGARYLVNMAGASISSFAIASYAKMLEELRAKRCIQTAIAAATESINEGEDGAGEIAARLEAALITQAGVEGEGPVSMMSAVTTAIEQADDAYHGRNAALTRTGVHALDGMIGGFGPGELILLGGRPSMGKTGVALAIAGNVARGGGKVAIASLEMTPESLAQRMVSEETSRNRNAVPYSNMRRGEMSEPQYRTVIESARSTSELAIQILPPHYRDTGALYAGAKRSKAVMGGIDLLIVDYLQLLRAEGRSRIEQITNISIALKSLAMQLNIPVLALSQLSRAVESRENKRPVLSDLRESGQLEQDADTVLFCYRDEYYLEREKPEDEDELMEWEGAMHRSRNRLEIIVQKQRQGEIGTAHVRFNPALNLIWENGV